MRRYKRLLSSGRQLNIKRDEKKEARYIRNFNVSRRESVESKLPWEEADSTSNAGVGWYCMGLALGSSATKISKRRQNGVNRLRRLTFGEQTQSLKQPPCPWNVVFSLLLYQVNGFGGTRETSPHGNQRRECLDSGRSLLCKVVRITEAVARLREECWHVWAGSLTPHRFFFFWAHRCGDTENKPRANKSSEFNRKTHCPLPTNHVINAVYTREVLKGNIIHNFLITSLFVARRSLVTFQRGDVPNNATMKGTYNWNRMMTAPVFYKVPDNYGYRDGKRSNLSRARSLWPLPAGPRAGACLVRAPPLSGPIYENRLSPVGDSRSTYSWGEIKAALFK